MCGIAGYFGSRPPDEAAVRLTLERMRLRGPDRQRAVRLDAGGGRTALLLHSRLSIVDLDSRSDQPMTRADATVVFNGELYNHPELRRDLESLGETFSTRSDTEVLLACWRRYGERCLDRFEGMWSFAVFEASTGRLTLARDRFGEKPLRLLRVPHGIYFASEVKFLAGLSGAWPRPDREQVRRYLALGYKALHKTGRTFFEGVEELAPAHVLTVGPEGAGPARRFWAPVVRQDPCMTLEEAVDGVRTRLIRSVSLRLRADVPVALCLSGGVDSTALASVAVKALGARLETFSIVDTDERYDERDNILATVRDLGCPHQLLPVSNRGGLDRLRGLVSDHDAPLATATYFVHSQLSEAMGRAGYRVVLSGCSADELFTGYYDHFLLHLHVLKGTPEYGRALDDWRRHIAGLVRNPVLRDPGLYDARPDFRDHVYDGRDELAAFLVDPCDEPFVEEAYTDDLLRNRMLNELFHEATPVFLDADDLNSMRCSVENRTPFLDTELFTFANAIPSRHLIRDGYGKYVLRQAVRGLLCDAVRLDRRKKGFNTSVRSIIDFDDPQVREYLFDPSAAVFDLVRRESMDRLCRQERLPNHLSKFVFSFVNARIFLELFGQGRRSE